MRKFGLFATIGLTVMLALAPAPKVSAEMYSSTKVFTNEAALANSTNATAFVIDLTKFDEASFQAVSQLASSGTANWLIQGTKSVDGVNFESTPSFSWTFAASGTSSNIVVTNCTFGSVGYLKITSVGNGNTSTGTATFQIGKKTRVRGNELN